jgi:hypothetical protein
MLHDDLPRPLGGTRIGRIPSGAGEGRPREPVMRRLYHRDRYGSVHPDRGAEGRQGIPARFVVMVLMVLAAVVVLTSLIH